MPILKYGSGEELRRVLMGMALDKTVLDRLAALWTQDGLFDSPWASLVGGWCVEYYRKYGAPPGGKLQDIYHDWAVRVEPSEDTLKLMDMFFNALADTHRQYKDSTAYLLDVAERYINRVRVRRAMEQAEEELGRGNVAKAREALAAGMVPLELRDAEQDGFPLYGMEELFVKKVEREEYLVDGVLVAGQPCLVAGPEKAMKTTIMLDLAVSLATGRDFLGHEQFGVNRACRVLLMSGESGLATLRKNLRTVLLERAGRGRRGMPRFDLLPGSVWLSDAVPRIGKATDVAKVRKIMEKHKVDVLVVDTASLALDGEDAGNLLAMQNQLRQITDTCRELRATFLLVHHFKKTAHNDPPTLADPAWAGFKEWARQWILLNRREQYIPPEEPDEPRLHRLWMVCGGSAGHSSCHALTVNEGTQRRPRWRVTVERASEAKAEAQARRTEEDAKSVLEALKDGPLTARDVQQATGLKWARLTAAIAQLKREGRIVDTTVRKGNNRQFRALCIAGALR